MNKERTEPVRPAAQQPQPTAEPSTGLGRTLVALGLGAAYLLFVDGRVDAALDRLGPAAGLGLLFMAVIAAALLDPEWRLAWVLMGGAAAAALGCLWIGAELLAAVLVAGLLAVNVLVWQSRKL